MQLISSTQRLKPNELLATINETFETLNVDLVEADDVERSAAVSTEVRAKMESLADAVKTFPEFTVAFQRILGLVATDNRQLVVALTIARRKLRTLATAS